MPITASTVPINDDCIGDNWLITDEDELARLVGLIAKAQAGHAECILRGIVPTAAVYSAAEEAEIRNDAIVAMTVAKDATGKETDSTAKYHRDGFLFEAISWIVARRQTAPETLVRDPHVYATTQGLDGLMIELNAARDTVIKTTVIEDKCTDNQKYIFNYRTLPVLQEYHASNRKVLESATTLLRQGVPLASLTVVAAQVTDKKLRAYRAGFPITTMQDDQASRAEIFARYGRIEHMAQTDRIGGTLITGANIRDWFEQFALKVIATL